MTELLNQASNGDARAMESVIEHLYRELRPLAEKYGSAEDSRWRIGATTLIHEASVRLFVSPKVWPNRRYFYKAAAMAMQRVLVDHARRRKAQKRDASRERGGSGLDLQAENTAPEMLDHEALQAVLEQLSLKNPLQGEIVRLHFYVGFKFDDIALILGCSPRTVYNHWHEARARLFEDLGGIAST